jgi:hypothetical protein
MRTPPHIFIVDDQPMHVDILKTRLAVHGYAILTIHGSLGWMNSPSSAVVPMRPWWLISNAITV